MTFLRGMFSEEDGSPSFSRVATGFIVAFVLGLMTYTVTKTSAFPDASSLAGLSVFITSLYATNKASEKASDILGALKGVFTKADSANINPTPAVGAAVAKVVIAAPAPPDRL